MRFIMSTIRGIIGTHHYSNTLPAYTQVTIYQGRGN